MGWSIGFDTNWQRDIGYSVPAHCDFPGCRRVIDRGLGYVCGGGPYGGEDGCGLYFCSKHGGGMHCRQCNVGEPPFPAKPDHPRWTRFKLKDPSWAEWRNENPEKVTAMREQLKGKP
jgi:hypothetical protein